jgi:predicted DNA-binding transcriptional regulator AlpA
MHDKQDTLLTCSQIAGRLTISERTLYEMRKDGTGPPFMIIRGSIKYRQKEFNEWLDQSLCKSYAKRDSNGEIMSNPENNGESRK